MTVPTNPNDACYDWKIYRLKRLAERMRAGQFGTPKPKLTDTEKIQVALLLIAAHRKIEHFAVWIDQGRLCVRYGLQGDPVAMAWRDAVALTEYFRRPPFRKTLRPESAKRSRRSA